MLPVPALNVLVAVPLVSVMLPVRLLAVVLLSATPPGIARVAVANPPVFPVPVWVNCTLTGLLAAVTTVPAVNALGAMVPGVTVSRLVAAFRLAAAPGS